ncbi:MAG: TIGR02679 family protein [Solirubrobacteraceae bacterium]|nr:TIGR02679 family protein [Solirubrobacteraceae bacterium]
MNGLGRIVSDAAARLERNGLLATGRLRLTALTQDEIRGLSGLLGPHWRPVLPGTTASVDLAALDAAMRASPRYSGGLVDVCAAARGAPLADRRAERLRVLEFRDTGWDALYSHVALDRHPALGDWLKRERSTGAAVRAGDPFGLLCSALDVLAALPAEPPQTLARFAAAHCQGDPHALDRDRPLDATVRRALAALDGETEPRRGAEARRVRYDRWGLGCDELSSTVLCLGVWPGSADPRVLTLRELREVERLSCGPVVFTCENPDVVAAAADALGAGCAPLICTGGWSSTACLRLLRATIAGGAEPRHHGDMDPEGLRILDRLIAATGGTLWRMAPEDYRARAGGGQPLGRRAILPVRHPLLSELASAITEVGRIVQEEQTLDELVGDLAEAPLRTSA